MITAPDSNPTDQNAGAASSSLVAAFVAGASLKESTMKRFAIAVTCSLLATGALAAPKSCEELKAEIEAKIQANNVTSYTLEIVTNDEVQDPNMVVGTCENGTKKIIYQRNDR
jgi:hypothetical protein